MLLITRKENIKQRNARKDERITEEKVRVNKERITGDKKKKR
jgi:hypothetical protein